MKKAEELKILYDAYNSQEAKQVRAKACAKHVICGITKSVLEGRSSYSFTLGPDYNNTENVVSILEEEGFIVYPRLAKSPKQFIEVSLQP